MKIEGVVIKDSMRFFQGINVLYVSFGRKSLKMLPGELLLNIFAPVLLQKVLFVKKKKLGLHYKMVHEFILDDLFFYYALGDHPETLLEVVTLVLVE